ncbi:MAG: glycoside hydrolase [Polaromonas sp.]|nr:glycoside hydrolase [Polaromonas sp.]
MRKHSYFSGLGRAAFSVLFVASLAACGGGGGGGGGSDPAAGSAQTPSNPPTAGTETPASSATRITGLNQQTKPNASYTVASAVAGTVNIMLPASPAVGDTVRITGESANQWRIAQNPGQSINTSSLANTPVTGQTWAISDQTPRNWWAVASSADGLKLVAATNGAISSSGQSLPAGSDGRLYTSADAGVTWTARALPASNPAWSSVASSADGTRLAAVGPGNRIWTSADSGATWQESEIARFWTSISMSADGSRMAAVVEEVPNGSTGAGRIYLYTQTAGAAFGTGTWTAVASAVAGARNWRSITMSDDGSRLAAAAHTDGGSPLESVYYSVDSGATWSATRQTFSNAYRVRSSSDGTRLVMAEGYPLTATGRLWTSTDSGATWIQRNTSTTTSYNSVDISDDGSKMLAVQDGGQIHSSVDAGVTWTARDTGRVWRGVAMSSDGNRATALVNGGASYASLANRTVVGANGGLAGAQNNTITLTYAGSGLFNITASTGVFSIQ